jgi:hypothetical protein
MHGATIKIHGEEFHDFNISSPNTVITSVIKSRTIACVWHVESMEKIMKESRFALDVLNGRAFWKT